MYTSVPRNEIFTVVKKIQSIIFPDNFSKQASKLISGLSNIHNFFDDNLDETEGLVVRLSMCSDDLERKTLVQNASHSAQVCLWLRFETLKDFIKTHPDENQMIPASKSKYLREALSILWHDLNDNQAT